MDRDLAGADLLRLLRHQQLTSLHRPAADDPATAEHRDHGPGDRGRISARRGAADRPEHPAQLGRCVWHDAGKELPSRAGFRQRALWGDAGSDLHSESDAGLPEHRSKLPDADAHGEGRLRSPVGVWRATLRTDQDTMMKRVLLVTIGLIFSLGAQAQTSCSLLSQCPNALLPLNGSEIMYIVQGGISRQVTTSNLMGVNTSILPLNNVWIGTNTFNGNVSILGPTNIFQSNISNFIQVINVSNGPDVSGALVAAVLGSSSVPNNTGNATIIGQKIGSGYAYLAAGVWGTFIDGGNTVGGVGYHGSGVEGTAQLRVAYSAEGPYFDGGTFRCEILSTSTNAECNGASIMNVYDTVNHIFALGVECDLGNNTGVD